MTMTLGPLFGLDSCHGIHSWPERRGWRLLGTGRIESGWQVRFGSGRGRQGIDCTIQTRQECQERVRHSTIASLAFHVVSPHPSRHSLQSNIDRRADDAMHCGNTDSSHKDVLLGVNMKISACRTSYARGFTLIELLVVIAIIAVLNCLALAGQCQSSSRSSATDAVHKQPETAWIGGDELRVEQRLVTVW